MEKDEEEEEKKEKQDEEEEVNTEGGRTQRRRLRRKKNRKRRRRGRSKGALWEGKYVARRRRRNDGRTRGQEDSLTRPVIGIQEAGVPLVGLVYARLEHHTARSPTRFDARKRVVEQWTELHEAHRAHELLAATGVHDAARNGNDSI